jgi:hypothetical protein
VVPGEVRLSAQADLEEAAPVVVVASRLWAPAAAVASRLWAVVAAVVASSPWAAEVEVTLRPVEVTLLLVAVTLVVINRLPGL